MNKAALSLMVPVVMLLGWVLSLEFHLFSGNEVRIRIAGYDPRDLLAGHYVRFRLDLKSHNPCKGTGDRRRDICLCLVPKTKTGYWVPVQSGSCGAPELSLCTDRLKGSCSGSLFEAGVERYSIPERLAPVLAVIPEDSSVILAIDKEGNGRVKKVMVGEISLEEYAEEKLVREARGVTAVPQN